MRRSTVILLVLFALLAGLTWYMQQPGNRIKQALATSTTLPAASNETLIDPNKGAVTGLQITDVAGKTMKLVKNGETWTINDGKEGPADQTLALTASSKGYAMTIVTKLEKAPDPAGTGLDKPAYTASVMQETGVTSFSIGKLAATGSGYYIQTADGSVYIVSKDSVDAFTAYLANPPFPPTATPAITETPATSSTPAP